MNREKMKRILKDYDDQILIPSKEGYVVLPAKGLRQSETQKGKTGRDIWKQPASSSLGRRSSRMVNVLQSGLMLISMIAILGYVGFIIAGFAGLVSVIGATGLGFIVSSNFKIEQILKRKNIRPIQYIEGKALYRMAEDLTNRAGLQRTPMLFFDNTPQINAYTVEDRENAAIVMSRGLLNNLGEREVFGVMAHEIAHLKNRDVRMMLFTEQIRRVTGFMALFGQFLLILNLPLLLLNEIAIPWLAIVLLMAAPTISFLIQIALSRNREFRADMDATELSGDPLGLASALNKVSVQTGMLKKIYAPYLPQQPEWVRTHPNTGERIKRLQFLNNEMKSELNWSR